MAACVKHSYINYDLFDTFITKMFDVTSIVIQRLAYNIRDTVYRNKLPLAQISKVSIDMLLEMTDIMDRVIIIQLYELYQY